MNTGHRKAGRWLGIAVLALAACSDGPSEAEMLSRAKEAAAKNDFRRAHIEIQNVLQKNAYSTEARFVLASVLYKMDQPALALVELRKAMDQGHPEAVVLPLIAKSMLKQGQAKALLSEYGQRSLSDPEADAELKTTLASALQVTGKPAEAQALIEAVLKNRPAHESAVLLKAQMAADRGDVAGGLAAIDELLKTVTTSADAWRVKGDLLVYGQRDAAAAIESYARALELQPADPLANKAIIFLLLARGELPQAEKRLAAMKQALPYDIQTRYFDAQLAFLRGDNKLAREQIEQVLKAMPDNAWALVLAGANEMALGRWTQAEAHLSRAVRLYPSLPNARILLARANLRGGDPARAISALEPLLTPRSQPPAAALTTAAEAHLLAGNPQQAVQYFEAATRIDPNTAGAQVGRAKAMAARGDVDAALAEFVRISAADSGNAGDLGIISVHLQRGRLADAAAAIDGLIKKRPNDVLGHKLRAEVALRQGQSDQARASFEQCLKIDGGYFPAVAGLAALDWQQGKAEQARGRFKALLEARPNLLQAQLALARLEMMAGASRETVTGLLQTAVNSHADDARPHMALIDYLLAIGDVRQALTAANRADQAVANHPEVMLGLARAQEAAGEHQHALATYGKMVSQRPNFVAAYLGLGEVQLRLKDPQGAANSFRRARQIQPDAPRASTGLVRAEILAGRHEAGLAVARETSARRKDSPLGAMQEAEVELARGRPAAAADAYVAGLKRRGATGSLAVMAYDNLVRAGARDRAEVVATSWLQAHPQDNEFKVGTGRSALAAGDAAGAERRFREVLAAQPNNVAAMTGLAWLLADQKKSGAVQLAERALALQADSPQVLDTLAKALMAEGQLDRAAETQLLAIRKRPTAGPSDFNFSLARIYLAQGKKDLAVQELNKLAALGDAYPRAAEVSRLLKAASD